MSSSDPTLQAARELFEEAVVGIRAAIDGASPEVLNARPAGDETNTIAVLATHAMHSTRMWFAIATGGAQPERDRPSEFVATAASADDLLGEVDAIAADCRAILEAAGPFEPGAVRTIVWPSTGETEELTSAWAILHGLEHLQEHVAHAQLTRQVLGARGG